MAGGTSPPWRQIFKDLRAMHGYTDAQIADMTHVQILDALIAEPRAAPASATSSYANFCAFVQGQRRKMGLIE